MTNILLGTSDWQRGLSNEPSVLMLNRYYEQNPTNMETQVALLSRPALRRLLEVGPGPVRAIYSQPGTFGEDLFVISGQNFYRVDVALNVTLVAAGIFTNESSSPFMVATGNIGETPEFLYICEGAELWLYVEDGYARGILEASGLISNGDDVVIGTTNYEFTTGSVDTGTPDGTALNPWLVARGADTATALGNLFKAINASGLPGTDYSTDLVDPNPSATATAVTATELAIRATTAGAIGNGVVTTETSAVLDWGTGTLTDGGTPSLTTVPVPDDVGVVSLGYVASYVIVVIAQGFGVNGRFYWIDPGETVIDPLDFATAERAPDPVHTVRVVGDQFWLIGTASTEVWYPTGNADAPFQRIQGRLFDRGIWEGTDVQIKDFVIVVDNDGVVYKIGSGPERISDHSIEERIREAMIAEKLFG